MRRTITLSTDARETLVDITPQVREFDGPRRERTIICTILADMDHPS